MIIRAILRARVPVERIAHRDGQTYFSILLDDNNRKPICRLFLEGRKKQIVLFDGNNESKHQINSLTDLYLFSDRLLTTIDKYERTKAETSPQNAEPA